MKNLRASTILLWAALAEYVAILAGIDTTLGQYVVFGATLLLIWGAWEWEQERKARKKAASTPAA